MAEPSKACRKCGQVKPLTDFYRHPGTADRRLPECRTCKKSYEKARQSGPGYAETKQAIQVRHRSRHPQKYAARTAVGNAIRDGYLHRQPCAVCGTETNVEAHHDDYSKPLDVVWLCTTHHAARHAALHLGPIERR